MLGEEEDDIDEEEEGKEVEEADNGGGEAEEGEGALSVMELLSLRVRLLGLAWGLVPGDEAVAVESSLGLL